MWSNFVKHTKKAEDTFWVIDFLVEDVMDNYGTTVMIITESESDLEPADKTMG